MNHVPDLTSDGPLVPADAAVLDPGDREQLGQAIRRLQASRGLIVRSAELLAAVVGGAAAVGLRELKFSPGVSGRAQALVELALRRGFAVALLMPARPARGSLRGRSRLLAAAAGALGGFAGLPGFLPDLAFTTLLIMRNFASVARAEGEDLASEEARRACLEVFALGSELGPDEGPEASYWSARLLLQGRPLVMLFSELAARFGLRISQKFAMQAIPLAGAAGGAMINAVFVDHYVSLAQVHFTMRRLERRYGRDAIHSEALQLAKQLQDHRESIDLPTNSESGTSTLPTDQQPSPLPPQPHPQPPPATPMPPAEIPTPPEPPRSPPQPPQA